MLIQDQVTTIAEVGLAHEGSLGVAHSYIDAIAETGATAVKFQTHIAAEESTAEEKFRVKVFPQDETRADYWQRTAFSKEQWLELAAHAREKELLFLSSPFSNLAVDWLEECDVAAWKIASGEITNFPMLARICETGKPVLLSSGMSSWQELDAAVDFVRERNAPVGLFQCTTSYPCPPEKWGLNVIQQIRDRYSVDAGLSDHSGTIFPSLAAVTMGATLIEFHVAYSKSQFGPDSKASLTFEQASEMVTGIQQLQVALQNPIDKDAQASELAPLHQLFTKSIVAAKPLKAGTVLTLADLAFKKPGTGIPANRVEEVVGTKLLKDVPEDHFFEAGELE